MRIDMMNIMLVQGAFQSGTSTNMYIISLDVAHAIRKQADWTWSFHKRPSTTAHFSGTKPERNAAEQPAEKSQHGAAKKKKKKRSERWPKKGLWTAAASNVFEAFWVFKKVESHVHPEVAPPISEPTVKWKPWHVAALLIGQVMYMIGFLPLSSPKTPPLTSQRIHEAASKQGTNMYKLSWFIIFTLRNCHKLGL